MGIAASVIVEALALAAEFTAYVVEGISYAFDVAAGAYTVYEVGKGVYDYFNDDPNAPKGDDSINATNVEIEELLLQDKGLPVTTPSKIEEPDD